MNRYKVTITRDGPGDYIPASIERLTTLAMAETMAAVAFLSATGASDSETIATGMRETISHRNCTRTTYRDALRIISVCIEKVPA